MDDDLNMLPRSCMPVFVRRDGCCSVDDIAERMDALLVGNGIAVARVNLCLTDGRAESLLTNSSINAIMPSKTNE